MANPKSKITFGLTPSDYREDPGARVVTCRDCSFKATVIYGDNYESLYTCSNPFCPWEYCQGCGEQLIGYEDKYRIR